MYDHIRTLGWTSKVFFFTLFVQGNLILLNLFLAILLKNFDDDIEDGEECHGKGDDLNDTTDHTSHDCSADNIIADDFYKRIDARTQEDNEDSFQTDSES